METCLKAATLLALERCQWIHSSREDYTPVPLVRHSSHHGEALQPKNNFCIWTFL